MRQAPAGERLPSRRARKIPEGASGRALPHARARRWGMMTKLKNETAATVETKSSI